MPPVQVAPASLEAVKRNRAEFELDPRERDVDALARRWAAGEWGGGSYRSSSLHPLEAMRLMHDGAVLGGGPTTIPDDILVFDAVMRERLVLRAFVVIWYSYEMTAEQKAERLGISRATIYREWKRNLKEIRVSLRGRGLDI